MKGNPFGSGLAPLWVLEGLLFLNFVPVLKLLALKEISKLVSSCAASLEQIERIPRPLSSANDPLSVHPSLHLILALLKFHGLFCCGIYYILTSDELRNKHFFPSLRWNLHFLKKDFSYQQWEKSFISFVTTSTATAVHTIPQNTLFFWLRIHT